MQLEQQGLFLMFRNTKWDRLRRTVWNAYARTNFTLVEWLVIILLLIWLIGRIIHEL